LNPRFPILGGWKSNFNIGYNLPSKFHISNDGLEVYSLNVTFGLPYENLLAKNYTVRVVLPEGASGIKVFHFIKVLDKFTY
jgi:oligosaccharyltransferase complex subunit alpha (ribophorin I)